MPRTTDTARRQKRLTAHNTNPALVIHNAGKADVPTGSLTAYLHSLPHQHEHMQKYLALTPPGSPAGSAPKTIKELVNAPTPTRGGSAASLSFGYSGR